MSTNQMSINGIEKQNVVYLYNEILHSYENLQAPIKLKNNDISHKYNTE